MIKDIQPTAVWSEGKTYNCNKYECYGTGDNYTNGIAGITNNYYALGVTVFNDLGEVSGINWVIKGNLAMTGEAYASWDGTNEAVVDWVASQLGLTYDTPGIVATPQPVATVKTKTK